MKVGEWLDGGLEGIDTVDALEVGGELRGGGGDLWGGGGRGGCGVGGGTGDGLFEGVEEAHADGGAERGSGMAC